MEENDFNLTILKYLLPHKGRSCGRITLSFNPKGSNWIKCFYNDWKYDNFIKKQYNIAIEEESYELAQILSQLI